MTDPTCQAIRERTELITKLRNAISDPNKPELWLESPNDGSEKALLITFGVLHGIVDEYLDGGDQMVEGCTCGEHVGITPQSRRI